MIDSFYISALLAPIVIFSLTYLFFTKGRVLNEHLPWLGLVIGNVLLLAVLVSMGVVVGESYYRFVYDTTDSFAVTLTTERWLGRHFEYNSSGYRDDQDYAKKPVEGLRRITFLGDSFTAGHGVADVEARFVNRMRAEKPEWEVHALAVLGANTETEIELLQQDIDAGYEIDLVILAYGLNDASELTAEWEAKTRSLIDTFYVDNYFVNNSYLVNTLYFRYVRRYNPYARSYFDFVHDHHQGRTWERLELLFYTLDSLVRRNGGQLLVVIFPFLHVMGGDYPYGDLHAKVAGFWEAIAVPSLDLLPIYRDYAVAELVVNRYDAHPNALAHGLAADALIDFVEEHLSHTAR